MKMPWSTTLTLLVCMMGLVALAVWGDTIRNMIFSSHIPPEKELVLVMEFSILAGSLFGAIVGMGIAETGRWWESKADDKKTER